MNRDDFAHLRKHGLVIDLFAGGGGASMGIEAAIGRPIDIALNHDEFALALHAANHPRTTHLCQAIEDAVPLEVTQGYPVYYLHASPSCTQFSRSRRAIPAERQQRDHAWRVLDWISAIRPVLFTCENVPEFRYWGPLNDEGFPIRERQGEYWREWTETIAALGYAIESKVINAANLGAATARERLMVVARRDGEAIRWPVEDHGPGRPAPWRQAADHIDWSIPAPSIFSRRRPLASGTLVRIRKGIDKFVCGSNIFIAPQSANQAQGLDASTVVAAFLAQNHSDLPGRPLTDPLSTICSKASGQSLVTLSFLDIARQNTFGADLRVPTHTICASGNHHAEVRVRARPRADNDDGPTSFVGIEVPIRGQPHVLVDVGYRFLSADELWSLQGFDLKTLKRDVLVDGKPLSATRQKKMIGNSVVPLFAERIVRANHRAEEVAAKAA